MSNNFTMFLGIINKKGEEKEMTKRDVRNLVKAALRATARGAKNKRITEHQREARIQGGVWLSHTEAGANWRGEVDIRRGQELARAINPNGLPAGGPLNP